MQTVIVQRSLAQPSAFEELRAAEEAVAWCLEQHRVRFLRSYLSLDGRAMVCLYEAPDADSVRETQRQGGLLIDHVWSINPIFTTGRHEARPGLATVIVEREMPQPMPLAEIRRLLSTADGCSATNRADLLESNLALDGTRMVCVFQAPDAESVRRASRQLGLPVQRAWTASVHRR